MSWAPRGQWHALSRFATWCPDCAGASARARWDADRARWTVRIFHDASCPVLRSARTRRACDAWLADMVGAVLAVADYAGDDADVVAVHRVRPG